MRNWERTAVFAFGVIFLSVILASAIFIEYPTAWQYTVLRITLALAASGIATFIPGLINVQLKPGIRAGGAIAVFVIVYFFSPAALNEPAEDRFSSATPQQVAFAYRAVFGPPPSETRPPLEGAKIGPTATFDNVADMASGESFTKLFKQNRLKVVMPFHIGSQCPRPFLDGLIFADSLSIFLRDAVDVLILNVGEHPTGGEFRTFVDAWNLKSNAHFFSGAREEMTAIMRNFALFVQYDRDPSGKLQHVNYPPIAYVFSADGKPLTLVSEDIAPTSKYILYYLANSRPDMLNRALLARYVPETSSAWIPAASAASPPTGSVLDREVQQVATRRTREFERQGKSLKCHSASHG